jgi:hypothetical protein
LFLRLGWETTLDRKLSAMSREARRCW